MSKRQAWTNANLDCAFVEKAKCFVPKIEGPRPPPLTNWIRHFIAEHPPQTTRSYRPSLVRLQPRRSPPKTDLLRLLRCPQKPKPRPPRSRTLSRASTIRRWAKRGRWSFPKWWSNHRHYKQIPSSIWRLFPEPPTVGSQLDSSSSHPNRFLMYHQWFREKNRGNPRRRRYAMSCTTAPKLLVGTWFELSSKANICSKRSAIILSSSFDTRLKYGCFQVRNSQFKKLFSLRKFLNRFYPKSNWSTKHFLFDIIQKLHCTGASKSEARKSTMQIILLC